MKKPENEDILAVTLNRVGLEDTPEHRMNIDIEIAKDSDPRLPDKKKRNRGQFQPGQSGNLNGKPTKEESRMEKLRKSYRDAAFIALSTLIVVAERGKSETARVSAAREINQRALGNAESMTRIDGHIEHTVRMSYEQLLLQMYEELKRREAIPVIEVKQLTGENK